MASGAERILPQADFPLEELTVVLLLDGPARAGMDRDEVQRLANEHLRYTVGLVQGGQLLHAGAIIDPDGERPVTGLGFSRLPPDEIARLESEDPGVKAGLETVKVVRYRFPRGGLRFAREG
jgi:hypothetical protein